MLNVFAFGVFINVFCCEMLQFDLFRPETVIKFNHLKKRLLRGLIISDLQTCQEATCIHCCLKGVTNQKRLEKSLIKSNNSLHFPYYALM